MLARVAGTIALRKEECPPKVLERLRRDLSFPNPEYVSRRRMGRYVGATPERIECLAEHADGWVELPRGAVGLLRRRAAKAGVEVRFEDHRRVLDPVDLRAEIELRPYQRDAVGRMVRGIQGTVVMPCGGGKTATGTAAIAEIGQPALVIVHTHDLLEQWRESVSRILDTTAGVVANGASEPAPITIATVQTVVRLAPRELAELGARFGCVIVDEAHHAPASTFQTVLAHMPARFRFGLTATPEREDGLTPLLDFTIGPRLFEIGYQELVAGGFLQAPEIRPVYTGFSFDYAGPEDHHRCLGALVRDPARNAMVADLAVGEAKAGHTVLVLSGRVGHCRRLAELVRERGVSAEVLVGAVKKADRRDILDRFRRGEVPVVVASTLADEGLDVPRLDRIVLAFPGRTKGRTAQRLGRLMRPHPDKQGAVLFDVVDAAVGPLLRQFRERRRLYRQLTGGNPSWR